MAFIATVKMLTIRGRIKMGKCKITARKAGVVRRTSMALPVDKAAVKEKLAAARSLRGMWANKDTSFFDEKKDA